MADQEYIKALRLGEKAARAAKSEGRSPYLPALDEILKDINVKNEIDLGVVDIPLDQIVGTTTVGRQNAFACNFMPLVSQSSEFAMKWSNLIKYQMNEGVSDPIVAYEYMNKFYVLEGNKRVSVFKYLGAFSIEGHVTRIVPVLSEDTETRVFYEFMDFYRLTQINYVYFSKEGSFANLLKLCGKAPDEMWDDDDRSLFSSNYLRFQKAYGYKDIDDKTKCSDAYLIYLSVYPYADIAEISDAKLKAQVDTLKNEFTAIGQTTDDALVLKPGEDEEGGSLLSRFFRGAGDKNLKVAFIHEYKNQTSGWTYSHELGRMHLEQVFKGKIETSAYFAEPGEKNIDGIIEAAIEDGNRIIFTTRQRFLEPSLRAAIRHPEVKILNCCVNRPYKTIRTYYGRMYEAKFLEGMIAGAMADNNKIAYTADYPIYGSVANINAFAIGASMTNPRAEIYLHWYSMKDSSLDRLIEENDIHVVADTDTIRAGSNNRRYGLYSVEEGKVRSLASPMWNWGRFYEKILEEIVAGTFAKPRELSGAMNYWWGISGGIIDLIMSERIPDGVRRLTELMRSEIYHENFHPFSGEIEKQDGSCAGKKDGVLLPEEIITMNWLCKNVIGYIPVKEELNERAQELIDMQGIEVPAGGERK